MGSLFLIAIGMFVGWNVPQPAYAVKLQAFVVYKWKEFRGTGNPS